jgi:hypothetical protein
VQLKAEPSSTNEWSAGKSTTDDHEWTGRVRCSEERGQNNRKQNARGKTQAAPQEQPDSPATRPDTAVKAKRIERRGKAKERKAKRSKNERREKQRAV